MRVLILLILLFASSAHAHEVRPAYLELKETAPGAYAVTWKLPGRGSDERLALRLMFPEGAVRDASTRAAMVGDAFIETFTLRAPGGLEGGRIVVSGLAATMTDVLARLERLDGSVQMERLTPAAPGFTVAAAQGWSGVASTYFVLGVEHILFGVDHLLFVLALLMLVGGWKQLVGTITAFTVAHSITLALATLGYVRVPVPPIEALIALSIAFVAAEIVRRRRHRAGLAERWPWAIAFLFGLLHGLGFASALGEVGLPQQAIPLALLFFNLGVETGQLVFVAAVLLLVAGLHWLMRASPRRDMAWRRAETTAAYAIGTIACFWVVERTTGFLG